MISMAFRAIRAASPAHRLLTWASALAVVLLAPAFDARSAVKIERTARRPATRTDASRQPAATTGLVWHVETLDGDTVDSRHGDDAINPASVTKVATTLWALEKLGPDHRFETRFLARQSPRPGGELPGDLLVQGGGDPDFQVENAMLVARELNRAGVRRVSGALVVNHQFWMGWEGGSQGREPDPGKRAMIMAVRLRQAFDPSRWSYSVRRTWLELAARRGFDPSAPPRVTFAGPTLERTDVSGTGLVVHHARPLVQILRRLNCFSNNDIERVGDSLGPAPDLGRFLSDRWGLTGGSAIRFETTSGLGENRLTPRQVVMLLRDLRRTCERMGIPIESVLPAVGCDPGTVAHFYQRISNGPASTSVVGKTGTLTATDGGVSVFAGFASTSEGEFIFCVAQPRAAGRLSQARWKEEQWVLDLVAQHGGPIGRTCAAPLTGPEDGAVVEPAGFPTPAPSEGAPVPVPAALHVGGDAALHATPPPVPADVEPLPAIDPPAEEPAAPTYPAPR
jgi:serine-type D-Ala-D-Ala carboxypeptidase/endopeptidase (penicillin-binding protein 4)